MSHPGSNDYLVIAKDRKLEEVIYAPRLCPSVYRAIRFLVVR
jgi:hypothetical protein